jgi:hypothetical protein
VSRYSQLYIDQTTKLADSTRARLRLGKLLERITDGHYSVSSISDFLEEELGASVKVHFAKYWPRAFGEFSVRDLLDSITLVEAALRKMAVGGFNGSVAARIWKAEAQRIFSEEGLAYAIDDNCIVHPAVDKEFQRNRQATVASLQAPRYANSLTAFERVSAELSSQPPNGKEAWRAVFTAVEGLFRLMFPKAPQLHNGTIDSYLTPLVQRTYSDDAAALRAANKQIASRKDWVEATHNYRHEPGSVEPAQPPGDLAVLGISNGAAFLRWLVALDQANLPSGDGV